MYRSYESNVKCIFISSTFKDMQNERDLIRDKVEPVLKDFAEKYGKVIQLIDLRWGVNTKKLSEKESSEKVLKTCLYEIDRCRPYFIGLLGNRYGWIPDPNTMKTSIENHAYHTEEFEKSVTELEIEYGVLRSQVEPVCFFYMRSDLDPRGMEETQRKTYVDEGEMQARLKNLKDRITEKCGNKVRKYNVTFENGNIHLTDNLAEQIINDIKNALIIEWGEKPEVSDKWQSKEKKKIENFLLDHLNRFTGRGNEITYLKNFALSGPGERTMLMIKGESGSGKSSLLAKLFDELYPKPCLVLTCFCGLSSESTLAAGILRIFIDQLSDHLKQPDESDGISDFDALKEVFYRLLNSIPREERVILVVDALDQLYPCDESRKMLWIDSDLPENARLICSITDGEEIEHFRTNRGVVWNLPALSNESIREITVSIAGQYHKELDKRVIEAIAAKSGVSGGKAIINPLYLSLIVQDLVMINRQEFEKIDSSGNTGKTVDDSVAEYMIGLIDSTSGNINIQYMNIIKRIEKIVGAEFVDAVLCMIAISRNGLREIDFAKICTKLGVNWNTADFSWMRQILLNNLIQKESGQWDFAHRTYREIIRENFKSKLIKYNRQISNHFIRNRFNDPFAVREVIYHAQFQNQPGVVFDILAEGGTFTNNNDTYGRELREGFHDPYIGKQYKDFLLGILDSETAPYDDKGIALVTYYYCTNLMPYIDDYLSDEDAQTIIDRAVKLIETKHTQFPTDIISKLLYQFVKDKYFEKMRKEMDFVFLLLAAKISHASGNTERFKKYEKKLLAFSMRGFDNATKEMIRLELAAYNIGTTDIDKIVSESGINSLKEKFQNSNMTPGYSLVDMFINRDDKYFDDSFKLSKEQFDAHSNSDNKYKDNYKYEYIKAKMHSGSKCIANDEIDKGITLLSEAQVEISGFMLENRKDEINSCLAYIDLFLAKGFLKKDNADEARLNAHNAVDIIIKNFYEQQSYQVAKISAFLLLQLGEIFMDMDDAEKCKTCANAMTDAANLMLTKKNGEETKKILFATYAFNGEFYRMTEETDKMYLNYSKAYDIYKGMPEAFQLSAKNSLDLCNDSQLANMLQILGQLNQHDGNYNEAINFYTKCMDAFEKVKKEELEDSYMDLLLVYSNLSLCCKGINDEVNAKKYLNRLIKAANSDDLVELGNKYLNGEGIDIDYDQALMLYGKAADQHNRWAMSNISIIYRNGFGVQKDMSMAIDWCKKAAELGFETAQYNLGTCYAYGDGLTQDYNKAVEWYTKAAAQGSAEAQMNLGGCYKNGKGVTQDYTKAAEWYAKAAMQRHAGAQNNLGVCYEYGEGVEQDYSEAVKWYSKAAEQGNTLALNNLGYMYETSKGVEQNYSEAVKWYTKAAEVGNVFAQNNLGTCYEKGNGVVQDYKKALEWYAKAAEQGNIKAQRRIGRCYYYGRGEAQDYTKAVEWYTKAAEQGDAYSQNELGACYYSGKGLAQDYKKAAEWYAKSAEQGDPEAQYNLGSCYYDGEGVEKDRTKALELFNKAAEQGQADAQKKLAECLNGAAE